MEHYYTNERNAQIVISLLKAHGIKKVIASPGTTNICFIASIQQDPYFEIYSAPEERSAAYIACGLSAESGEPVVISCTGATASRNYMPGLTEAYYRKLPVLALTSSRRSSRIGHNIDQVTDRTVLPKDVAKISVQLPLIWDKESEWAAIINANKAILELRHHGCGPVHINLETDYSRDYSVKKLPDTKAIFRFNKIDRFPKIDFHKIVIWVGAHLEWSKELVESVEKFCAHYNAVVVCDHTGNYKGKYGINANLIGQQIDYRSILLECDLMIHLGEVAAPGYDICPKEVWRVSKDGELIDTYRKLRYVFEMNEEDFFEKYCIDASEPIGLTFFEQCTQEQMELRETLKISIEGLPFSNIWIAAMTSQRLPENSVLHLGIQNSLRFWNFFEVPKSVLCYSNTGGFGIDGSISSAIGASLARDELVFCVLGDLAFFYDLNSLGNRHVKSNLRILLVNNGKGTEFKLEGNPGFLFKDKTDLYIAAADHYGRQSRELVKNFAENLGFIYLSASSKEEYLEAIDTFVDCENISAPIILEVFTNSSDEDLAFTRLKSTLVNQELYKKRMAKLKGIQAVKGVLGEKGVKVIKKAFSK